MAEMKTAEPRARRMAEEARERVKEAIEERKPMVRKVVKGVEEYSPVVFTGLSLASIIASVVLFSRKSKDNAIFVGLWAPTFLSLGLLYTLVGIWRKK